MTVLQALKHARTHIANSMDLAKGHTAVDAAGWACRPQSTKAVAYDIHGALARACFGLWRDEIEPTDEENALFDRALSVVLKTARRNYKRQIFTWYALEDLNDEETFSRKKALALYDSAIAMVRTYPSLGKARDPRTL